MRKEFVNPEIKISSAVLFLIISIFLFATVITQRLYYNGLKSSYIKTLGAVTEKAIDKNPELEKELVPLVTKGITKEDESRGEKFLNQYGLNTELENNLFPYLNENSILENSFIIIEFLVMGLVLLIFNFFQYKVFYKKISSLITGAKKVIEGDYYLPISEHKEGALSKLALSFNSMREIIRNNINELSKEKQFLVDLLSDISHQLKTPLSSMIVYNDIMLNKELSKEQRETFLLNNQNQLNRMNWLIQSILKLAKLDAKAIEFEKEEQSLNETIEEAIEVLQSKALEREVRIYFNSDEEVKFEHDRLWLQEAFINIIKNGIEHTDNGGEIRIDVYENPIYKKVIIEDNGEGIEREDLPNIFKRFYKGKTSRNSDSVGIGLALGKSIIESHNGYIEVMSQRGKGTKFTITFLKY
ncbi:HAMP domain-containing sensor histidine kinase [Clostridium sp. 'White wine YQ']|uniref:HAMP domain-containing sensor histidine kinase n=1 Tax=Clostridium sp. 'White wine YQ' TaxID=3027474 RepID=UPI0023667A2F|nr:HAMP domain-containing sensor histidine kinase [Clostridium sp. 'White wine YQ']MDD7794826.1 HAMP domain-containing sensor histidine kinase [Clostridium sp. 'White wine YQ']